MKKQVRRSHWNLSWTKEREERIEKLRERAGKVRADGERIHGALTTAQIFDWALVALIEQIQREDEKQFGDSISKQYDTSATSHLP